MKYEVRSLTTEARASKDGDERFIEGLPIVYDSESRLIGENGKVFKETINRGAMTNVLASEDLNVRAVWMRDRGSLLGTTKSGTVVLTESDEGVSMRLKVPNTTLGNDIYELIERGDITEMSFSFAIGSKENETWTENSTGEPLRTISRINAFKDVSFVDEGAYGDTSVAIRNLEEFEKTIEPEVDETYKIQLERDNEVIELLNIK